MACNLVCHKFAPPLVGSLAMKDNMLFGCYGAEGKVMITGNGVDDTLGELREEEIVWGEAETQHQHKDNLVRSGGGDQCSCKSKVGMKMSAGGDDRRVIRHRSLLSRQMEIHTSTWAAGGAIMSAEGGRKQSSKGSIAGMREGNGAAEAEAEGGWEGEGGGGGGVHQNMDERIPPHELLARQYATSAATSFSVLQGAGRTLKGMDLRRLRNEVWRQTGFAD